MTTRLTLSLFKHSARLRLFLAISIFLATSLIFFSYLVYQAVSTYGLNANLALVTAQAERVAQNYHDDQVLRNKQSVSLWMSTHHVKGSYLALLNPVAHRVLYSDAPPLVKYAFGRIAWQPSAFLFEVGAKSYGASTQALPGSQYALAVIQQIRYPKEGAYLQNMALPLLLAFIIALWVSVWAALYIGSLLDKVHHHREELRKQAREDTLTKLPNRAAFNEWLAEAMAHAEAAHEALALLIIDLNEFKAVNDTLGHACGDRLLEEVALRMVGAVRENDFVARLGGDEFAIVLGQASRECGREVVNRLARAIRQPVGICGCSMAVSASIGAAFYPEQATTAEELFQHADVAMYEAKLSCQPYLEYSNRLERHSKETLQLAADLHQAVARHELFVVYQPKTDIHTGKVIALEALLRWKHPTLGLVPPDRFIPLAEKTGTIQGLTRFVAETALQDLSLLLEAGQDVSMAINLSAANLHDEGLPQLLFNLSRVYDVSTSRIILELTETAILDGTGSTLAVLDALAKQGFIISLDDFGTGYSSLSHLRKMSVQELKIDKSFVANMLENEEDAILVRSIIELGHFLGKKVVAEGVEDPLILEILQSLKCDVAQGYLISKPLAILDLKQWLNSNLAEAKKAA